MWISVLVITVGLGIAVVVVLLVSAWINDPRHNDD